MKKGLSKILALLVTVSMLASVTGFSMTSKKSSSKMDEAISLDVFTMTGNYAGEETGWYAKIVKDKFNIDLNIISSNLQGGDSKFATQMASGNLGDIVVFGAEDQKYTDAIKAGLLLDWTKNDLLNKYGKDIATNYSRAVEKNKTNFGSGKAVYGLGYNASNMPATASSDGTIMGWGPNLRWDLYEKLGKPKIKTMEDLLPILKNMQKIQPKSDSGKPTYAFSMWPDWDGNLMMNAKQFSCMLGWDEFGLLLVGGNQEKYQELLDPKGLYFRTLKLYYTANKMGLVDPDSISQKYDDASNKIKDGQILFSWFPWMDSIYNTPERMAAGKGFMFVPFGEEKIYSGGFANGGSNRIISIGSKTKYPERVMQFINWMYTPDGIMAQTNGPKGLTWDLKNGKPYLTEYGKKTLNNQDTIIPDNYGGGSYRDGISCLNFTPVNINSTDPQTNEPYNYQVWTSTLNAAPTKVELNWRKAMGAISQKEYVIKHNMITVSPVSAFAPTTMSSDLQQKIGQIATVIKQNSWKMIFAKNDAEYNALQKEMITKSKGLGSADVVKFNISEAKRLFAARKLVK